MSGLPRRGGWREGPPLAGRATDREVVVVAAVVVAGSEKAAAHRLGLSHSTVKPHLASARSKVGAATTAQLVWILAERPPEPEGMARDVEAIDERKVRVLLGASRKHHSILTTARGTMPSAAAAA